MSEREITTPRPEGRPTTAHIGEYRGQPDVWLPPELVEQLGVGLGDAVETEVRDGEIVVRAEREERDDAGRWECETGRALASVRSCLFSGEIDTNLHNPIATVSVSTPIEDDAIPLGVDVADGDDAIAALAYLSPADAEALAANLRGQARIVRDADE